MPSLALGTYTAKKWNLSGLNGISDHTLEVHFGLYEGYVKNANSLNEQIQVRIAKHEDKGEAIDFAEITRHLGFEYNGMRLHEYYFDNLTDAGGGNPGAAVRDALAANFGDFETWKGAFTAVGGMRGVGWAIAYQDPTTGRIVNDWVTLHESGNLAGFNPILVMDVWEHAFMFDYKPAERTKYIEAFFANVNWDAVASRLARPEGRVPTLK